MVLKFQKHTLYFKFDAGTSRGVLKTKDSWILKVYQKDSPNIFGLGEVSIIDRLSFDYSVDFDKELAKLSEALEKVSPPSSIVAIDQLIDEYVPFNRPAIRFGLETALYDLIGNGKFRFFNNGFYTSKKGIPINGLVWMGEEAFMQKQIEEKIKNGFKCIKIKIGAIDFDTECKILKSIRKKYKVNELTLRVDANGAFKTQEVLKKLEVLDQFDLHSIEQPIMPHQLQSLKLVCQKSNIPVALDEELIGVFSLKEKKELLDATNPQFIVLKPSLLGGFRSTKEWIELAEERNIGWWITSALESNIGLNAICQFTAEYDVSMHQGLGTGQLYENNFHSPLVIRGEEIFYHQDLSWDHSSLNFGE
ncbi:MAG: o-succinylbenzoate synthase [Reichenbachiella sp.]